MPTDYEKGADAMREACRNLADDYANSRSKEWDAARGQDRDELAGGAEAAEAIAHMIGKLPLPAPTPEAAARDALIAAVLEANKEFDSWDTLGMAIEEACAAYLAAKEGGPK